MQDRRFRQRGQSRGRMRRGDAARSFFRQGRMTRRALAGSIYEDESIV